MFLNNINSEIAQNVNLNALTELSNKVDRAENNNTFHKITSSKDGVIVYEMDGFENYTVDDIVSSGIDYTSYKKTHLFTNTQVKKNDPVFKRVDSENWNVIVPITESLAKELNERKSLKIRFCKDDYTVDTACSIMREEDSYYLNLSLTNYIVLNSLFDLTKGITLASLITNETIKIIFIILLISIGSLNINIQIKSILSDTDIKYSNFLKGRLISTFFSILHII